VEEDADEPLERVLVHRVDVGQIGHAEEEDLSVDGDWDVLTASGVNVTLCLLGDQNFRLSDNKQRFQIAITIPLTTKNNNNQSSNQSNVPKS